MAWLESINKETAIGGDAAWQARPIGSQLHLHYLRQGRLSVPQTPVLLTVPTR
jgi:hypothetical protein